MEPGFSTLEIGLIILSNGLPCVPRNFLVDGLKAAVLEKQDMVAQFVNYLLDNGEEMERNPLLSVVKGETTTKSAALKSAVAKGLIHARREGRKNVYWADSTRH